MASTLLLLAMPPRTLPPAPSLAVTLPNLEQAARKAAKEMLRAEAEPSQRDKTNKPEPAAKQRTASGEQCHALVKRVAATKPFKSRLARLGQEFVTLDHVTHLAYGFAAALVMQAAKAGARVWFVCSEPRVQDSVHAELAVWQTSALYFPKLAAQTVANALPDPDVIAERIAVLSKLQAAGKDSPRAVVLLAGSLDEEVPALLELESQQRMLAVGQRLDVEAFSAELAEAGYERVPQVTERGQFARRGGILDFYTWHADEPLRVELFDDEIESLRVFDVNDQGSVRRLERAGVILKLSDEAGQASRVSEHVGEGDLVVGIECHAGPRMNVWITEGAADGDGPEDYSTAIHEGPLGMFDASDFVLREARRAQFDKQMAEWQRAGWETVIFFNNDAERERFDELVEVGQASRLSPVERASCPPPKATTRASKKVPAHSEQDAPVTGAERDTQTASTLLGLLYRGFTVPTAKLAVLTGSEIFGRHQTVRRIKGSKLDETQALRHARDLVRELREHDLVVHVEHGIGKFAGVEVRGEGKSREEVLVLRYADEAKLFVSMANAHLISRYVGVGGKAPALNKLGDARWAKTRKNAERSVEEFAARMLSIAAERQSLKAEPHPPDTKWQAEFEGSFIYQETPDQLRSVEEIKRDMEAAKPMDRLLCADVGFGKTEVAIRAAFKTVMSGRQVAILVPTTVLAAQHWKTLRERMSEFPVKVEMLCRLTPADKEREIIAGLKDGSVDIVVGTHRVISRDVHFKHLGLAVVDEEQRFGVKHKEKFKELFRLIDVLTLSATPIPRTLYLALMGMRDMSTIETPPANRHAVGTVICPYDEVVIRDAINAEIARGGQVYFLHNRVGDMDAVKAKLMKLCPKARIVIGHGQMDGELLEAVMHKFVNGEADVLLCTTIIESGVDVPNANTIIIDRADRFGLADLYQLRGRVGRSDVRAHAYLFLPRDFVTGGDARKRVNAMKQYTALGSGFKIAMRDLEIRGAGNLLGTEQSGHIAAVGFDMYCQMLKISVNKMQGKRAQRPVDVGLRADFLCLSENAFTGALPGLEPAFIPSGYMEDAKLRIQAYRAVAEVTSRKELDELEAQWRDQHGRLPPAMLNLIVTTNLRLAAANAGISDVEFKERKLMLRKGGNYVMMNGKFPRMSANDGQGQMKEALALLRQL